MLTDAVVAGVHIGAESGNGSQLSPLSVWGFSRSGTADFEAVFQELPQATLIVRVGNMITPRPIRMSTWARRETFEHYRHRRPTYLSITVDVDVTELQRRLTGSGRKTYPTQIWALATVVNRHEEFRMTLGEGGQPAVWDVVDPSFTVFNPERETFANVWVPYNADYPVFHDAVAGALREYRSAESLFPQGFPPPLNLFDISSMPWTSFSGVNLNVENGWSHLSPVFALGRFTENDGRTTMPVALQIHHSSADGFHVSRLLAEFADLVGAPDWLEPR
nr:CatA-like O-acetyltransferase [Tsukamurella pulmonis]